MKKQRKHISQPQSQSQYLDRPAVAMNPANFRGSRCLQDARPDPPKSETSSDRKQNSTGSSAILGAYDTKAGEPITLENLLDLRSFREI